MKDYPVITLNLYIILTLVSRMVIQDGVTVGQTVTEIATV